MSREADLRKLIVLYNRRLQKLKEQAALQGINTSPETQIEIEEIEAKLESLEISLKNVQSGLDADPHTEARLAIDIDQELARLVPAEPPPRQVQIGGVNLNDISGSSISIGHISTNITAHGDIVGGDKIVTPATEAGPDLSQGQLVAALVEWQQLIEAKITILRKLDDNERAELKNKAGEVRAEAAKGSEANPDKLERLLNTMISMAPDILDVTAKTLQNPLAGVGLVLEKINDRIKFERQEC